MKKVIKVQTEKIEVTYFEAICPICGRFNSYSFDNERILCIDFVELNDKYEMVFKKE